jgi:hypothetical protein
MFKKIVGAIALAGCLAVVAPQGAGASDCVGNVCDTYILDCSSGTCVRIQLPR